MASLRGIASLAPSSITAGALHDYWIDWGNRYLQETSLLSRAMVATADFILSHDRPDWSLNEADMLDRAFGSIYSTSPISPEERSLIELFGVALFEVQRHRRRARSGPYACLHELFNTLVPIWPELGREAITSLTPTENDWHAWLELVASLAYIGADNPLGVPSWLPWRRFGRRAGIRWSTNEVAHLEATLDNDSIIEGLRHICTWTEPTHPAAQILDDISTYLLDDDLPRRRRIMLHELASAQPADYWVDEYGGARNPCGPNPASGTTGDGT